MAGWRHQQRAIELVGALIDSGSRLVRRRPGDLGTLLAGLADVGATDVLSTPEGHRDAWLHLGTGWQATVTVLAQPDTLPSVVEHRTRVRVHPAGPWATAGVAAAGSAAVVAGSAPAALEVAGVGGVAVVTALGIGWLWRPRASRADRNFAITGAPAIAARGQALVARQATNDPDELRSVHRLHAIVVGGAEDVQAAEDAAAEAGLLDDRRNLIAHAQLTPAHRALVDEVLLQRAELVQALLELQQHVVRADEQERRARRTAYRRLLDDPLDDL